MEKREEMSDQEFLFFSDLIHKRSGIKISNNKKPMLQSRLTRRLHVLKISNFQDYISYIKCHPDEAQNFINSLTTNKTDFFREVPHFNFLKSHILPELVKDYPKGKIINIWSAACSSGPEPYTLAMIMDEFCRHNRHFDYSILATDIDTRMLELAKKGVYSEDQVAAIPKEYFTGNFARYIETEEERKERKKKRHIENPVQYQISERLRKKVSFREFNLLHSSHTMPLRFEAIFLRNVLIYFPGDIIQKVINKLYGYMTKGSYLFLGHSENLNKIDHGLDFLKNSIYRKKS